MEHRYTLEEIDRMRSAIGRKHEDILPTVAYSDPVPDHVTRTWEYWRRQTEDELRTCMIAGIRPEELEEKYPDSERS